MKKRFKLLVPALILLIHTTIIKADIPKTYQSTMATLANSFLTNDFKSMKDILSNNATLKLSVNNKVIVNTKNQIIEAMQAQKEVLLDFTSDTEYLSVSEAIIIARLDMKFKEFTVFNYVTLEKNEEGEWKVVTIYKLYNKQNNVNKNIATLSK